MKIELTAQEFDNLHVALRLLIALLSSGMVSREEAEARFRPYVNVGLLSDVELEALCQRVFVNGGTV